MSDPVEDALRRSLAERANDPSPAFDMPAIGAASRRRRRRRTAMTAAAVALAAGLTVPPLLDAPHRRHPETLAGPSAAAATPTEPDELARRVLAALGPTATLVGAPDLLDPAEVSSPEYTDAFGGRRRASGAAVHVGLPVSGITWTVDAAVQALEAGPKAISARDVAGALAHLGGARSSATPVAAGRDRVEYAVFATGQGVVGAALLADGSVATVEIFSGASPDRTSMSVKAIGLLGALGP